MHKSYELILLYFEVAFSLFEKLESFKPPFIVIACKKKSAGTSSEFVLCYTENKIVIQGWNDIMIELSFAGEQCFFICISPSNSCFSISYYSKWLPGLQVLLKDEPVRLLCSEVCLGSC